LVVSSILHLSESVAPTHHPLSLIPLHSFGSAVLVVVKACPLLLPDLALAGSVGDGCPLHDAFALHLVVPPSSRIDTSIIPCHGALALLGSIRELTLVSETPRLVDGTVDHLACAMSAVAFGLTSVGVLLGGFALVAHPCSLLFGVSWSNCDRWDRLNSARMAFVLFDMTRQREGSVKLKKKHSNDTFLSTSVQKGNYCLAKFQRKCWTANSIYLSFFFCTTYSVWVPLPSYGSEVLRGHPQ